MVIREVVEKSQLEMLCGGNVAVLDEAIQIREQES
jgi:hypothetical protein